MNHSALTDLGEYPSARRLLEAYECGSTCSQEGWIDRLTDVDGVEATELSAAHGKLIAFGYLDVQVDSSPKGMRYQVTTDGRQALRGLLAVSPADEADQPADEILLISQS